MKKPILLVLLALGVLVAALLAVVAMQPGEMRVERSLVMNADIEDVEPWIVDLRKVNEWSPWEDLDPDLKRTFSETTDEVGAVYSWDGNDDVGAGNQTIMSIEDGKVVHALHFDRPFESDAIVTLTYESVEEGTEVSWGFSSQKDFMTKAVGLFMDIEAGLAADFEKGLAKLKPLAEGSREEREAAEAAEEAEGEDTGGGEDTDVPADDEAGEDAAE